MATTVSSTTSSSGLASPGIGSGLDINGIVSKLMAVEQKPVTALLQQEASYQAKISAYGSLKSAVSSLKSAVDALKSSSLYSKMTASVADSTVLSATANSAAKAGTYQVEVVGLASAETLTSRVFTSTSDALSTVDGKLKIEIGTTSGTAFTPDSARTPVTIDITSGNSTLQSIRDQINAAKAGVTAKIVAVDSAGTSFKLSITSNTSGAAGSLRITAYDSALNPLAADDGLGKLSYAPSATNQYTVAAAAQDAHIRVDGVDLYRSSNVIGDAITGVSFTATKAGASSAVTIAADTASMQTAVQSFVKTYNDAVALGRKLSNYDLVNKQAAILTGDSAARSLLSQLSGMMGLTGPNTTTGIKRLSDIGISVQRDGSLNLDASKLQGALNGSLANVTSLLSSSDTTQSSTGIAVQMSSRLSTILSDDGLLATRISGIQSTIKSMDARRASMMTRLTQVEANYRKQFTALDTMVASMQQTSSYLTQQLSMLQKSTGG